MANPAVPMGGSRYWEELATRALAYDRAHPQTADTLIAVALAVATTPWLVLHTGGGAAVWVCQAALIVPIIWRRRYPVGVFSVLVVVALIQWIVAEPLLADVALLGALFTIAYERPLPVALAAGAVLEVGVFLASFRWALAGSWDRSLVGLSGLSGVALLLGAVLRARRAHLAALTERATRLELERDQQAQIAAAAERTRIAREMHDVIAHSLAVIVTMADGAAAKLNRDPEQAGAAIESIAQVGRQALGDTRRLLGVLRDQDREAEMAPQPGLDQLADLIRRLSGAGLDASVDYTGHPFPLTPGAELVIYRLVQEAATNTLKHAAGATILKVRIDFSYPTVEVEVSDDGLHLAPAGVPAGAASADPVFGSAGEAAPPGGHGIAGMRERIALYGGHLQAGPRPRQGWVVQASFDTTSGAGEPHGG